MKVMCIDAKPRFYGKKLLINEGQIYTVLNYTHCGLGVVLAEVKSPHNNDGSYWTDRFAPLSDLDEMELVNERELINS